MRRIQLSAVFKVKGTFILEARTNFVVYGEILEGTVAEGMVMQIPLNSSTAMAIEVSGVDFVDGSPTGSHLALRFACDSLEEAELLDAMDIVGEELKVVLPNERT